MTAVWLRSFARSESRRRHVASDDGATDETRGARREIVCAAARRRWRAGPAAAQVDLSGEWAPVRAEDNIGNPELGDWVGIPMNDAARLRSTAWDASIQTLPEWQCRPHGSAYISRGPSQLKIWKEVDPVSREITAWHLEWLRSVDRPIYMDGRPHPSPNAAHTWAGFSTGEWIGDMLRVRVTHLKEEYLRRNGVLHSDKIELTQYLIRRGDYLTFVVDRLRPGVSDRAAVRSTEYQLNVNQQIPPYPCTVVTEVDRPKGVVPHYLPGTNNDIAWFSRRYKIPIDVVTAGAANMYPEIRAKIPRSLGGFGPEPPPRQRRSRELDVPRRAPGSSSGGAADETIAFAGGSPRPCGRGVRATSPAQAPTVAPSRWSVRR